jgi:nucleoid DNA-binding protein
MTKETSLPPTLTKQRLVREIGRRTGIPNRDTSALIDALIVVISDHLAIGGRVELANFLTLDVRAQKRIATEQIFGHTSSTHAASTSTYFTLRCKPGKRLRAHIAALSARAKQVKRD